MRYEIDSKALIFNGKNPKLFFEQLITACEELDINFFVVGAFARDLLLEHIYNQKAGIATRDIDLAIRIDSWKRYNELIEYLKKKYQFKEGRVSHEFISSNGTFTDIVPFGKIEKNRSISFPPNFSRIMNMVGFEEIYNSSIEIIIDKSIVIKIASIEGIVILKLIAWKDRQPASISQKHVRDIYLILSNYFDIKVSEFAQEFSDIFDAKDYNFMSGGARALGRRIGQISKKSINLVNNLNSIFEKILSERDNSLFITQMMNNTPYDYEYVKKIMEGLIRGFDDIVSNKR